MDKQTAAEHLPAIEAPPGPVGVLKARSSTSASYRPEVEPVLSLPEPPADVHDAETGTQLLIARLRDAEKAMAEERRYFSSLMKEERRQLKNLLERQLEAFEGGRSSNATTEDRRSPGVDASTRTRPDPTSRSAVRREAERLVSELRELYQSLMYHCGEGMTYSDTDAWCASAARYDAVLVRLCDLLGIATGNRPGERLSTEARVALTTRLADAGYDVRKGSLPDG